MSASAPDLSFLILGATGYIGGAVAVAYKTKYPSATFVTYTRSSAKAPALEKAGFKPLVGTGDSEKDLELIKDAVKKSDVVVNAADADDLALTKAILAGLEESSSKHPILIHTSGTGVLAAKPWGGFEESTKKIYDDTNVDDLKSLSPSQPHRAIDLAILEAANKHHSINYIIAPSTIYGVAAGNPGHKTSDQVPSLIRLAIKKRQTLYGGEGTNHWNNVHLVDLIDLYHIILDKALVERATGLNSSLEPYERFYFASVGQHTFGDVARGLAPLLHARGLVDSPEALSAPVEEVPIATVINSRSVSNRAFKDGWKPSQQSLEATFEEDIEGVLEEDGLKK